MQVRKLLTFRYEIRKLMLKIVYVNLKVSHYIN